MERTDVQFSSGRDHCAAWLYWPATATSDQTVPCVVMAPAFSLTRHDAGLPYFAERFAQAGYAVLLFDYRYLGDSAGQPRQRVRISAQLEDWRNAIAFARGQRGIDPDRIVLWGCSLTGGHVVATAAQDHQVAAALVLFPLLNGLLRLLSMPMRTLVKVIPLAIADQCGWHQTVPVAGPVGARAMLTLPGEAEGIAAIASADSPWRNAVLPAFGTTFAFYQQTSRAPRITCPLWVGLGDHDITVHRGSVQRLARRAPHGVLQCYPYDHWEPFKGQTPELIIKDQLDFLAKTDLRATHPTTLLRPRRTPYPPRGPATSLPARLVPPQPRSTATDSWPSLDMARPVATLSPRLRPQFGRHDSLGRIWDGDECLLFRSHKQYPASTCNLSVDVPDSWFTSKGVHGRP